MDDDRLRRRIAAQFSGRGERADIWRGFDRFLETEAFLNLGYSRWYQSHLLGSPQYRLATRVGTELASRLDRDENDPPPGPKKPCVLDVGCGRGGPAIHLADRFGFSVVGVDLVTHNVALAAENARSIDSADQPTSADPSDIEVAFVVGDATQLPFAAGSVAACTAIDALVYVPERERVLEELAAVLEPGGLLVVTDLLTAPDLDAEARDRVAAFADAWDMPPPWSAHDYVRAFGDAGFELRSIEDLTPNSVGRFRKWTTLYGLLQTSPGNRLLRWLLDRWGLDPAAIASQVRRAHEALPVLRHGLFVARRSTD